MEEPNKVLSRCRVCVRATERTKSGLCHSCNELVKIVSEAHFNKQFEPAVNYIRRLVKRLAKKRQRRRQSAATWLSNHLEYIGRRPPRSPHHNRLEGESFSEAKKRLRGI